MNEQKKLRNLKICIKKIFKKKKKSERRSEQKTLQKKRSWFSWNKQAPLKGHALIKIPERFNSIV